MTQDTSVVALWDAILRCQVDVTFPQELAVYYASEKWQRARSVIDIGTGNGYYLTKLASYFPDKTYYGVDRAQEFIQIAQRDLDRRAITFESCELFDVKGCYDVVIMRLVLQHVQDIDAALDKVTTITNPEGSAFLIDAYDAARLFRPDVPRLRALLAKFEEYQTSQGLNRAAIEHITERIMMHARWQLSECMRLIVPSTIPNNLDLLRQIYTLVIQLLEKTRQVECDFEAVKQDWDEWSSHDVGYTQLGLNVARIDRYR